MLPKPKYKKLNFSLSKVQVLSEISLIATAQSKFLIFKNANNLFFAHCRFTRFLYKNHRFLVETRFWYIFAVFDPHSELMLFLTCFYFYKPYCNCAFNICKKNESF